MDISSLSNLTNSGVSQFQTQLERETARTESFQSVLDQAVAGKDRVELKKACVEFESYFISMMFKEMRKTVHSEDGILPQSFTEQVFQEMLDEETSKRAAETGGMGLADMMYRQLSMNLSAEGDLNE